MKRPLSTRTGLLLLLVGQPAWPVQVVAPGAARSVPVTCSVQTPVRATLVSIFFAEGLWVKRGQVLAKLERPNNYPVYLSAPVAGRIGPVRQPVGTTLPAHTVVAVIEASTTQ